ncbi:MAG: hypothetical protein WC861_04550 [Candidatus Micrarchaeia archaeon]|jgi:hypothetical protein
MARHRAGRPRKTPGKRIVYITPYRNLAVEMKQMYEKNGERAEIGSETDRSGQTLYMVYLFEKGY